jgi:hypothetical protein
MNLSENKLLGVLRPKCIRHEQVLLAQSQQSVACKASHKMKPASAVEGRLSHCCEAAPFGPEEIEVMSRA